MGVTNSLGYTAAAHRRGVRQAQAATMHHFEMSRADFVVRLQRDDIELHGIDDCLNLLGLDTPAE